MNSEIVQRHVKYGRSDTEHDVLVIKHSHNLRTGRFTI